MQPSSSRILVCLFSFIAWMDLNAQKSDTLLHTLAGESFEARTLFGYAVAVEGRYIVVGEPFADQRTVHGGEAVDSGEVKIFDSTTGELVLTLPTPPSLPDPTFKGFGRAVAISGSRIAVGSAGTPPTPTFGYGTVFVYDLASPTPTRPTLTLRNPKGAGGAYSSFGTHVALFGTRLAVGSDKGHIYAYDLAGATPSTPVLQLEPPVQALPSVAISGNRLVVGFATSRLVSVYDLTTAEPGSAVLTLPDPGPPGDTRFGYSVAISDTRVAVGAIAGDAGATDTGTAYVFDFATATPKVPVVTLTNPRPTAADSFGWSMAMAGSHLVVGAPYHGSLDEGSAYLFDLSSQTPGVPVAILENPDPAISDSNGDYFGAAVAISADRLVVGSYGNESPAYDTGSAYMYNLAGGVANLTPVTLENPPPCQATLHLWRGCDVRLPDRRRRCPG